MLRLVIPKGSLEAQTLRLFEEADLAVRRGSDRDYHGTFRISDLHGPLSVFDVPLDAVEDIHGSVTLSCPSELVNTGSVSAEWSRQNQMLGLPAQ